MALTERRAPFWSFLLIALSVSEAARLNVPRILLPYLQEVATNYTLKLLDVGGKSCYEWQSSRPDVATVSTEGNCPREANVSAVWSMPNRQTAMISVHEPGSGETLRCDVIVDELVAIQVVSTTHELLMEDSPELLELVGHNRQGDTFSSLEGISFDWNLQQQEPVLRFVPVSEWPYLQPGGTGLQLWESRGRRGWAVLLEGQAPGTARLSVRPTHVAYTSVVPQELELHVVDSVRLEPSAAFVLAGCQVCFQLQRLVRGRPPSPVAPMERYAMSIEDSQVARLEGQCIWAQSLGTTRLLLTNAHLSTEDHQPGADVHVVKPSYLRLSVSPGDAWVLEFQSLYTVKVQLFDDHHHRIHSSEGLQIHVTFPPEYFKVELSTENGTLHQVRTLKNGHTMIRAELEGCRRPDGALLRATATGEQEVSIQERLSVQPETVWLPWDPKKQPVYTLRALAHGGSGAPVRWQLHDGAPLWAMVEGLAQGPVATVVTRGGPGQVRLMVRDGHFAPAGMNVTLVPVAELEAFGSPVLEAELPAGELLVAVAMYGRDPVDMQLRPFDDCSKVSLTAELVDKGLIKVLSDVGGPPVGRGCTSLRLQCLAAGHTRLQLSHGTLRTTLLLGCYKPLRAVHPAKSVAVPYGAFKDVAFEGGPRAWPMLPAGHRVKLSPSAADLVSIMRIMDPFRRNRDLHVFRVLCKGMGEMAMELYVGNNVSASLPSPASSKASIRFACSVPASVEIRLSSSATCPENKVPSSGGPLELELAVRDANGRRLANLTSLDVLWDLSDYTLAQLVNHRDVTTHVDGSTGYQRVTRDFQVLQPQGKTGTLTVTATVRGFSPQVLRHTSLPQHKVQPVSGSLQLELVEAARLSANKVRVLAHPSHKLDVTVLDGSGHFALEGDGGSVAKLALQGRQVQVHGLGEGHLELQLHDRCLPGAPALPLHVDVVWPAHVQLAVGSQVQLGEELEARVWLDDARGEALSPLPLVGEATGPLALRPLGGDRFAVRGIALGSGTARFVVGGLPELASPVATVHVFAPLRLEPRNLTLAVGATYQLGWSGGPSGVAVEFGLSEDMPCLSVSATGLVRAKGPPCQGRVWAAAATGGRDETSVHVVSIGKLELHCPLRKIVQGSQVPVHIQASGGLGPAVVCLAADLLRALRWAASEPGLVSLAAPLTRDAPPDGLCVAHVHALRPGRLQLRLLRGNRTVAQLSLEVLPPVDLLVPAVQRPEPLVLSPGAQLALKVSGEAFLEQNQAVVQFESPVLRALSAPGTATLWVRREQQIRLYLIQVDPMAYALVRPAGGEPWDAADAPLSLPVGLELLLEVVVCTEQGQRFHAANLSLGAHSSRSDLVSVEQAGDLWRLRVYGAGQALVRWSGGTGDRVQALLPLFMAEDSLAPLLVGERVWLQGPLAAGQWVAEGGPLRLVSVAPGCSLAHLTGPGEAVAFWTGSPQGQLRRALVAQPADTLRLEVGDGEATPLLLAAGQDLLLPVRLGGRTSNVHGEPCGAMLAVEEGSDYVPFSCWVAHLENKSDATINLLQVSAGFSLTEGGHWCRVWSAADMSFPEVPLLVGARLPGRETHQLPLLLVAPIQLLSVEMSGDQAVLVFLAGPTVASKVQVRPAEGRNPLPLRRAPEPLEGGSEWKLTVRVPPATAQLLLESPITGQQLRVPLDNRRGTEAGWMGLLSYLLATIVAGVGAWTYIIRPQSRGPSAPATSPFLSAAASGHNQRSPTGALPQTRQTSTPPLLWSRVDGSDGWNKPS
ncbi:LOW QUALITY PROTEIN: nucleoporin 210 [Amblyomma americanum]